MATPGARLRGLQENIEANWIVHPHTVRSMANGADSRTATQRASARDQIRNIVNNITMAIGLLWRQHVAAAGNPGGQGQITDRMNALVGIQDMLEGIIRDIQP